MPGASRPAIPPPPPQDGKPGWYRAGQWPDYSWIHWNGAGWTETMEGLGPNQVPPDAWTQIKQERLDGIDGESGQLVTTRAYRDPSTGLVWTQRSGTWIAIHKPSEGWRALQGAAAKPPPEAITPGGQRGIRALAQGLVSIFGAFSSFIYALLVILILVLPMAAMLNRGGDASVLTPRAEPTATTESGEPATTRPGAASTAAGSVAAIVDGECNETFHTGPVTSAQAEGVALSYNEVKAHP